MSAKSVKSSRKRKEFGARAVETRHPRSIKSLCCVIGTFLIGLSLMLCWCGSLKQHLLQFGINVFPAMFYLICARELYIFGRQWMTDLPFKRSIIENLLFMGLIPGVAVILCVEDVPVPQCLLVVLLVGSFVVIFLISKINRNMVDSTRILERVPNVVGAGLAMAFSRYLENVIIGKTGTPRYNEAICEYRKKEDIADDSSARDWILDKVMILFPEANEARGSVEELVKKDNQDNKHKGQVNHRLCFKKIKHDYEVNGQKRVSRMEVLKVYDGFVCGYVVIAENMPLNTLYSMVEQREISEEMFRIQFHAYKNELKRLLDLTKGCKGKYEFFHYKDSKLRDFGSAVIAKINLMRLEELS